MFRLPLPLMALALTTALTCPLSQAGTIVTHATLKNGLRVVIIEDKLAPVVTTQMNYLVGSAESPPGFPGTAHAVEHMLFRGSPGLSKEQLSTLIADLGGRFAANTYFDSTRYQFTVSRQDLTVALHIEALRMEGADFNEAQW